MATTKVCDRCNKVGSTPASFALGSIQVDLCGSCMKALSRFLDGEDQVGEYVYVSREMPCTHFVPCAGPCGETVYKLEKRQ